MRLTLEFRNACFPGIAFEFIKRMIKILLLFAMAGTILFFPIKIGTSACLFGHLTDICIYDLTMHEGHHSHSMLNHYMLNYALFWWGSIGLLAYVVYRWICSRKRV
jgi:hypothetical protein